MSEELNLHGTIDAKVWAKEFCRLFPDAYEGLMISWFANAIMTGVDSVPRADEWHDISTLPSEYEDGRELLVADVDSEVHHVCWDNKFENWWPIRGHRPLEVDEVFFWMPLYKPPQSMEGE